MASNNRNTKELADEVKAEIRRRVTLDDVIRDMYHIELRGNRNISCPLPSHQGEDSHPSFGLFNGRFGRMWKCHSEEKSGDMFAFVREMDGVGYYQSVLKIAQHYNIDCSELERRLSQPYKNYRQGKSKNHETKQQDARSEEAKEAASRAKIKHGRKDQKTLAHEQNKAMKEGLNSKFGGEQFTKEGAEAKYKPKQRTPVKSTFVSLEDAQKNFGWTEAEWQAKKADFDAKHKNELAETKTETKSQKIEITEKYKNVKLEQQRVREIAKDVGIDKDALLVLLQNDDSPVKSLVKSAASVLKAEQVEDAVMYLSELDLKEQERVRAAEAIIAEAEAIVDNVAAPLEEVEQATEQKTTAETQRAKETVVQDRLPLVERVDVNHEVGENGLPLIPRKTVIVNLLGGPGSGKSTLAHEVTSELKKAGFTVGFVSEYASEMIRDGRADELRDGSLSTQQELFIVQAERVQAYLGKVDFVVTESPTILSAFYLKEEGPISEEFKQCVRDDYRSHNNFTCMVKRGQEYIQEGRVQDAAGAAEIDDKIRTWMREEHIKGTYNRDAGGLIAQNAARYYGTLHGIDVRTHSELIEDLKPPQGAWNCLKLDAMHTAELAERAKPSFTRLAPAEQEARLDAVKADAVARVTAFQKQGALPSQARLMVDGIGRAVELDSRATLSAQFNRAKNVSRAAEEHKASEKNNGRTTLAEKTQQAKRAVGVER